MGRQTRYDWEGCIHHIMVRGIDGRAVFSSEIDKNDLSDRFKSLVPETSISLYAWAFMPNHIHILVRTGSIPISQFMHRLLTGYAVCYNIRHERTGHVFQGRFKSILIQEESYFLKLVKYIHLNPLKAGIVQGFKSLRYYDWCGHSSLLGLCNVPWHNNLYVLSKFRNSSSTPEKEYLKFIKEEMTNKETERLVWGNYILGNRGITTSAAGKTCDLWGSSCRILGTKEFAIDMLARIRQTGQWPIRDRKDTHESIMRILTWVQDTWGISLYKLRGNARSPAISDARALVAWVCSDYLGLSKTESAVLLGMSRTGIIKAIRRGVELYADSKFIRDNLHL